MLVLQITGCHGSGDAYSRDTFDCSVAAPCLVSYRARGRPWQGFSSGFPDNHIWAATPSDYRGNHMTSVHDNNQWHHVEYVFPVGDGLYTERDYTATIGPTHFMFEGFDMDCDQTMLDDVVIKRYTGSQEQAAAINAAIQPANVLFAEDFESGSGAWHGKGSNPRPETGIVSEDRSRGSMVMRMQDCTGGGDAFTTEAFECSPTNKCLINYWVKGRMWQGFSSGFADDHVWTAVPDQKYNGGVGEPPRYCWHLGCILPRVPTKRCGQASTSKLCTTQRTGGMCSTSSPSSRRTWCTVIQLRPSPRST